MRDDWATRRKQFLHLKRAWKRVGVSGRVSSILARERVRHPSELTPLFMDTTRGIGTVHREELRQIRERMLVPDVGRPDQTLPTCEIVDATDIQRELRPLVKPIDRLMRERGWSQIVLRLVGGRIQVVVDLEVES